MELTRKQIYDMMWTDGVGKTEQALGLRQPELKSICDKYNIPRPTSGYWSALRLGKPVEKETLKEIENDSEQINVDKFKKHRHTTVKPVAKPSPIENKKDADGKYPTKELPEDNGVNPLYSVPDILYAKDPIILDTKAKLREENFRENNAWNAKNPFTCKTDKWLSMRVSQSQEDRALRIYATIIKAAKANGYELKIVEHKDSYRPFCTTYFVVHGHEILTFMKEVYRQKTNEDGTKDRYNTEGSGMLRFECDKYSHHYSSYSNDVRVVQDTKYTRLEDKIEPNLI